MGVAGEGWEEGGCVSGNGGKVEVEEEAGGAAAADHIVTAIVEEVGWEMWEVVDGGIF